MRKLLFIIFVLCGCSAWAIDDINVVFVGNSITYGATLQNPGSEAPPVRVKEILSSRMANRVNIINCGHSGSTTVDWLPGTAFFDEAMAAGKALKKNGGVMFFLFMLGTNDSAIKGPTGSPVSLSDYEANMRTIIDALRNAYPEARFIINYPIWYSPNTHNGATYLQEGLDRLKSYHGAIDALGKAYQKEGAKVWLGNKKTWSFFENNLDLFTKEPGYDGTFYLHPNKEGAVKLAEFWAQSIVDHAKDVIDTKSKKYVELIDEAEALYKSAFVYSPLIKSADCLSTNSITMQNQLDSLVDGNTAQNLQTWPEYGPDTYCWIKARMNFEENGTAYVGMTVPSGHYPGDYPAEVMIEASDDGEAWTELCTSRMLAPSQAAGAWAKSDMFEYNPEMKYIRVTSLRNNYMRAGKHHFAIGEFNVFVKDKTNSLYFKSDEAKAAVDCLKQEIEVFKALVDCKKAKAEDAERLKAAMKEVAIKN